MYLLFRVLSNTVLVNRYDIMNVYDSLHRCINNIILATLVLVQMVTIGIHSL